MQIIFEWDARKAQANESKHKVAFEEAKTLFADPFLVTFPDEYHSDAEDRFISIGCSARGRILLVVHTEREMAEDLVIRIISCRKATPSERSVYEEEDKG